MAWEVTRTVRVRLDVPDNRKSDLHATNTNSSTARTAPQTGRGAIPMKTA
jgi:hypothetical protein